MLNALKMNIMRKGLLLVFSLCLTTLAMAQFASKYGSVTSEGRIDRAQIILYDSIYNESSADLTPRWKRTVNDLVGSWESAVCIGELCYAATESEGFFADVFLAGTRQLVSCYFYPDQSTNGQSNVEVSIYDPNDSLTSHVTLNFTFNGWPLSVEEAEANGGLQLYPNPATDQLFIEYTLDRPTAIQVFDLQGRMVWSSANLQPGNRNIIPIGHLADGQYLLHMIGDDGQTVVSKAFTKQ